MNLKQAEVAEKLERPVLRANNRISKDEKERMNARIQNDGDNYK